MKRQNNEACTVGAKMSILKGRRLAGENVGKGLSKIRSRNPEDPEKSLDGVGHQHSPGKIQEI